ncbi:MAG: phosphate/phosphite/phosphonate ABC transporter substrate-binding protein [Symploca sp. SIO2E9]|nr:phosphate/phosphite/phosphonate ABC transporter substrate-binding protein [Symploca sp. SIO2E9]
MLSRRLFLLQLLFLLTACRAAEPEFIGRLSIGVVSYGEGNRAIERFSALRDYLAAQLKAVVDLEPAYNEVQALAQIKRKTWSLVFAPPGLAAIAIAEAQYLPLFPLEGLNKVRSVILVLEDSPIQKLNGLAGKVVALGQPGSATGYYLPIYNLYGLTLAEARFAPTPKTMLQWIADGEVVAGAMSLAEFERYRSEFAQTKFRILYLEKKEVPAGAVLAGPRIELNQLEQVRRVLESAPPNMTAAAGYIPNTKTPDYEYLIEVVKRVRPIAERIKQKPVPLYETN